MDISICDFATLQKGLYLFSFLDGGPGFFSAAIYASTERFSLVWRCFRSSVSLVQLLNVIQLFMYMSLFFKQYFVNVDTVKASLRSEAGPDGDIVRSSWHLSFITGALQLADGHYHDPAGQWQKRHKTIGWDRAELCSLVFNRQPLSFVFFFFLYAKGEQLTHVQQRRRSIIDVENVSVLSWERNA